MKDTLFDISRSAERFYSNSYPGYFGFVEPVYDNASGPMLKPLPVGPAPKKTTGPVMPTFKPPGIIAPTKPIINAPVVTVPKLPMGSAGNFPGGIPINKPVSKPPIVTVPNIPLGNAGPFQGGIPINKPAASTTTLPKIGLGAGGPPPNKGIEKKTSPSTTTNTTAPTSIASPAYGLDCPNAPDSNGKYIADGKGGCIKDPNSPTTVGLPAGASADPAATYGGGSGGGAGAPSMDPGTGEEQPGTEQKKMNPILLYGLIAGGAFLIYKVFIAK